MLIRSKKALDDEEKLKDGDVPWELEEDEGGAGGAGCLLVLWNVTMSGFLSSCMWGMMGMRVNGRWNTKSDREKEAEEPIIAAAPDLPGSRRRPARNRCVAAMSAIIDH